MPQKSCLASERCVRSSIEASETGKDRKKEKQTEKFSAEILSGSRRTAPPYAGAGGRVKVVFRLLDGTKFPAGWFLPSCPVGNRKGGPPNPVDGTQSLMGSVLIPSLLS
jgi:hypothetical protein